MVEPRVITPAEFEAAVGRPPRGDDMDRVNCPAAGDFGHWSCGWNDAAGLPEFLAPSPGRGVEPVDRVILPADGLTFVWLHGGSEAMHWTSCGKDWWASVWPTVGDTYGAWVLGPSGSRQAVRDTEAAARAWCEDAMRARTLPS